MLDETEVLEQEEQDIEVDTSALETETKPQMEETNPNEKIIDINTIQPIAVVINSRNDESANRDAIRHLQMTALFPIHVYFYQNKGIALTSVYNEILKQVKEDRVVFVHDDVEFISAGWARTLWKLFENNKEYGIIGVAGSKDFDESGAWWIYKNKYGQVYHRKDVQDKEGNKGYVTFLTKFSEELDKDLEEVCVIDGLFMAIDRTRTNMYFDNNVGGFNFYDINLCLDNFEHKATKIGVTTKIKLSHKGLGVIKPEWFVNRKFTLDKFSKILPISNLEILTPTEGKVEVDAFKKENDPLEKGLIKVNNGSEENNNESGKTD